MTAYLRPTSLDEALALRAAHPDYAVVAGGTDLLEVCGLSVVFGSRRGAVRAGSPGCRAFRWSWAA